MTAVFLLFVAYVCICGSLFCALYAAGHEDDRDVGEKRLNDWGTGIRAHSAAHVRDGDAHGDDWLQRLYR